MQRGKTSKLRNNRSRGRPRAQQCVADRSGRMRGSVEIDGIAATLHDLVFAGIRYDIVEWSRGPKTGRTRNLTTESS